MEEVVREIKRLYEEFIEPSSFIREFKNESEFRAWLTLGTKEDLLATLTVFQESELYEVCTIIKSHIDNM